MPQIDEIRKAKEIGYPIGPRYIWSACIDCGKERWVRFLKGKAERLRCRPCSDKKNGKEHRGFASPCWKGGRYLHPNGYVFLKVQPDDFFYPMADHRGYVLEHRLVIARALGRCLFPWEVVHHKQGYAKDDNRYPETLELLPSQYKHDALTKMGNYIKSQDKEIRLLKWQVGQLNKKIREIEPMKLLKGE